MQDKKRVTSDESNDKEIDQLIKEAEDLKNESKEIRTELKRLFLL